MSFNRSPFKSIQQITVISSAASGTFAITSVDPNYSMIILNGVSSADVSGFACGNGGTILTGIPTATTVSYASFIPGGTLSFTVVEFWSYQLRQAVAYGIGALNGIASTNIGIVPVGPKAFVNFLGMSESINTAQTDMGSQTGLCQLTSTTNVQLFRQGTGGINAPDSCTMCFCVVDPW